jgi:hypothetical protein
MNDKNRPRPQREDRPGGSRRPAPPRGLSSDELLEMADELEEQARDLVRHARHLQRLAEKLEQPASRPPFRGPRPESGERGGSERGSRERGGGERGGERPPARGRGGEQKRGGQPSRRSATPAWVPKQGRKRPEK